MKSRIDFLISSMTQSWKSITVAILAASVCLIVWLQIKPSSQATETMPAMRGEEAVSYLKRQGLYSSLAEAMTAARYGVHWTEHTPWKGLAGAYYANNAAQQMTAFFTGEGIHLESKSEGKQGWKMGMKLSGYGYGENLLAVSPGQIKATGNRIEIQKSAIRNPQSKSGTRTGQKASSRDSALSQRRAKEVRASCCV